MKAAVKIIECPRDAWQGLPVHIPAETKAAYLAQLIRAGFTHIDAVSFVSAKAIPQMHDSERALEILKPPAHVEIIGIVVNRRGAERAIQTGAVRTLGFPYSISPEFLRRNQHQNPEEALAELDAIVADARSSDRDVVAYVSMAFGNPYNDSWSIESVVSACEQLAQLGLRQISLADTVGLAEPDRISGTVAAALRSQPGIEIGVHLHSRRARAADQIRAAYAAGCRRFDAALGGLGGCPFAQDSLVGNIPTEVLIVTLAELGADVPGLKPLDPLIRAGAKIAAGGAEV